MITVQEITVWNGAQTNHRYILSDDRRLLYGYYKDEGHPTLFDPPLQFDVRRRQFEVLVQTKDYDNVQKWKVTGSKGTVYTVTSKDGYFTCTCPAATFRGHQCKHIDQIKNTV